MPSGSVLRQPLLFLSRRDGVRRVVTAVPATARLVAGYVAGERADQAVAVATALQGEGLLVSLDHLGEDVTDVGQAAQTVQAYLELLAALSAAGLARSAEVSLKLSALGQALPEGGEQVALDNARTICRAARNAGTTVTLDMEDHTTTDSTLAILRELRLDYPETGAVLQAYLRRTEADCRHLAYEGSRVRLCKGAYAEPVDVAFTDPLEVDKSYVRCLKLLLAGQGYPMIATHDPRLIEIARSLAARFDRQPGSYEFQMLYGVRPREQRDLAAAGERMRVYVPYGRQWYPYLMRRLAERPQNLSLFVTSLFWKK